MPQVNVRVGASADDADELESSGAVNITRTIGSWSRFLISFNESSTNTSEQSLEQENLWRLM